MEGLGRKRTTTEKETELEHYCSRGKQDLNWIETVLLCHLINLNLRGILLRVDCEESIPRSRLLDNDVHEGSARPVGNRHQSGSHHFYDT